MIINFKDIEYKEYPNFKGGEDTFYAKIEGDAKNKIISGKLQPGGSIGLHTHETNSEIIFILSGTGKVLYQGEEERVEAGVCHYCPQGHSHSLINDSEGELVFCAVIPEH